MASKLVMGGPVTSGSTAPEIRHEALRARLLPDVDGRVDAEQVAPARPDVAMPDLGRQHRPARPAAASGSSESSGACRRSRARSAPWSCSSAGPPAGASGRPSLSRTASTLARMGCDLAAGLVAPLRRDEPQAPPQGLERRAQRGRIDRAARAPTRTGATSGANCWMSLTFSGWRSGTSIRTLSTLDDRRQGGKGLLLLAELRRGSRRS